MPGPTAINPHFSNSFSHVRFQQKAKKEKAKPEAKCKGRGRKERRHRRNKRRRRRRHRSGTDIWSREQLHRAWCFTLVLCRFYHSSFSFVHLSISPYLLPRFSVFLLSVSFALSLFLGPPDLESFCSNLSRWDSGACPRLPCIKTRGWNIQEAKLCRRGGVRLLFSLRGFVSFALSSHAMNGRQTPRYDVLLFVCYFPFLLRAYSI